MNAMTKNLLLLFCMAILLPSVVEAQTMIPNGGFENWQNVGNADEEPTNWNGNKTASQFTGISPQTCFRESSNPHSGTYCLKLQNGNFFGTGINASITTSRIMAPSTNPADGYMQTLTNNSDFNSTFTGRPDSLVTWIKFTQSGSDTAQIKVILHDSFDFTDPDQGSSAAHLIGIGQMEFDGSINSWTRVAIPINYVNGMTPSYIMIIATASKIPGSADANTIVWLDDMEAVYCSDEQVTLTETACNSYTSPSGNYTWTSSGTYMDTLPKGNCDSILTINLTVNTVDTSVTDNGSSLMANASGATYQWVDCNNGNAAIPGATSSTFTPTMNGSYAVEVTMNGCTEMSSCYSFVMSSVEEVAFEDRLAVYPNPTNGQINVDLGAAYDNVAITVTDINGKVVRNAQYTQAQNVQLNLDQQAAGVYFVAVTTATKRAVVKLIKQ